MGVYLLNDYKQRTLIPFFIITFAFTWILWIPTALSSLGFSLPSYIQDFLLSPFNPAAFGPMVAAFILTYKYGGGEDLKILIKKGVDIHFNKIWLIPLFFFFPLLTVSALLLAVFSGESLPNILLIDDPLFIVGAFFYIFFLGGPLQEEFGWRGYALPGLQMKYNALVSSLILGIIWGAWHLPLFFIKGSIQSQTPIWGFMILIICGTVFFTWIYNHTQGSILAAMIFHTMNNLSFLMFPTLEVPLGGLYLLIINIIVVIGIVAFYGPERLNRQAN